MTRGVNHPGDPARDRTAAHGRKQARDFLLSQGVEVDVEFDGVSLSAAAPHKLGRKARGGIIAGVSDAGLLDVRVALPDQGFTFFEQATEIGVVQEIAIAGFVRLWVY